MKLAFLINFNFPDLMIKLYSVMNKKNQYIEIMIIKF